MIERKSRQRLELLASQFPVVLLTGPRQSGKTTLSRATFPQHPYVNFENLDISERARIDPRGFLSQYSGGAILDEIQRAPQLFSYLQQHIDEDTTPGRFILTGSQQFGLVGKAVQTLAGRVGLLELLPFSLSELQTNSQSAFQDIDQVLWRGWYPPIHDRNLNPDIWYEAYISTYLERDVRQIEDIRDMAAFRRFLMLAAGRTGQLVNLSSFAADCGVSHNTVKSWLSVLEASYIIKLVQPYYRNFNKRVVKTPKLFFLDTGLAARLLGITAPQQLLTHPLRGALFESFIFGELLKRKFSGTFNAEIYFWRDHTGREVDFILDNGGRLEAIEVKSGATFHPDLAGSLNDFKSSTKGEEVAVSLIYGGNESFTFKDIPVMPWNSWTTVAESI